MSDFKYGVYTAQDPNDHEKRVLVDGLEKMDDWEDLKLLIEPCIQKIYDDCKGSGNNAFKMLTWEFQQSLAIGILAAQPPCLIRAQLDPVTDLIRIKTVRAIEDATRRIEIKDFLRCERYIREQEKNQ